MKNTAEKEHIKLSSCMWLGGADCMMATLCNILTGGGLTFFFVNYLGMNEQLSAISWLIFGIWNAINDPLFGYLSDNTKSKLGRRIPYIRYGSVLVAVVFCVTWISAGPGSGPVHLFIAELASLFLFDALYTAIATSLYVMPFEMAVTNEARSKILFVKVIFSLIALSVPLVLLAKLEEILATSLHSFRLIMLIIGIVAGVIIFVSTFFYKEHGFTKEEEQFPFLASLVECFKNKNFLVFESISFSVTFIQTALMLGLSYYFNAFSHNLIPCYGAMFAGILIGMFLWMKPGSKWGVKKCIVIMCLVFGGGLLVMMLLGKILVAGIIGFFCSGIGFAGGMYLVPLMNGDVIDFDEHRCGLRREGMYAGVNSFICKPAISIANAAFPAIIAAFGFNKDIPIAAQTDHTKTGILIGWLLISIILLIICAILINVFYSLSGKEWDEIKEKLSLEHHEKQKAFEEEMLVRLDSLKEKR